MKKRAVWILAALLLLASGCGGQQEEGRAEDSDVALNTLYAGMEMSCGWGEDYMTDVEGELLEECGVRLPTARQATLAFQAAGWQLPTEALTLAEAAEAIKAAQTKAGEQIGG